MAELVGTGDGEPDPDEGSRVQVELSSDGAATAVLTVSGELDLSSEATLRSVAEQAIDQGATTLAFDMSGLTFMDSSGIGVLLTLAARVSAVEIRNPSITVRRVIELSGLASTLRMSP